MDHGEVPGVLVCGPASGPDTQLVSQLVTYWLQIEAVGSDEMEKYINLILDNCTASVCRAFGWEGNIALLRAWLRLTRQWG